MVNISYMYENLHFFAQGQINDQKIGKRTEEKGGSMKKEERNDKILLSLKYNQK